MKKKVLFIINNLKGGGAEKALVNLMNNLNPSKYNITCKVLFNEGINIKYLKEHINYQFVFNKTIRGYSHIAKVIPNNTLYKFVMKNEKYDIEVAFLEGVTTKIISGSTNLNSLKVAWIHTEFNSRKIYKHGFMSKEKVDKAYKKFDKIVTVSKDAQESFYKLSACKSTVIENIVDINLQKEYEGEINSNFFNFITVGRLTEVKGYERLIYIMKEISKKHKIKLHILGEGALRSKLEKLILELGLDKIVYLYGYIENPASIVEKCDLFICSSYREGLSTVVAESIAVGTPVLTTDCSGMKELLKNNKYGLIVENSEQGLLKGIQYLLDNQDEIGLYKKNLEKDRLFRSKINASIINKVDKIFEV